MSSGQMSMASGLAHVRVTADRGQWFVEVRPATAVFKWFDLEHSIACGVPAGAIDLTARPLESAVP